MDKSNKHRKETFEQMLIRFQNINKLSPFPIIDTEQIMFLSNKIKNNKIDYDMDPVVCCAHCKNLAITITDDGNDVCILCSNSINETETHATIFHYLNLYEDKWREEKI